MSFTRQQYMNKECSHDQYYEQFCNDYVIGVIDRRIGVKAILASDDEYFNDIPLSKWDSAGKDFSEYARRVLEAAGDIMSMANLVCIGKAAARIIKKKYSWPDQYLYVECGRTGDAYVMPISSDEPINIRELVEKWVQSEFHGEVKVIGYSSSYLGEYNARVMLNGEPPQSVRCWESIQFNTDVTFHK